jgi:hypothetical protein
MRDRSTSSRFRSALLAGSAKWSDQLVRLIEEATMFAMHLTRVEKMYFITDRLHNGRTVQVSGRGIAPVVSAWLAELGAHSPLVEDLARAACIGDWAAACAVGEQLSVDVTVAAAA